MQNERKFAKRTFVCYSIYSICHLIVKSVQQEHHKMEESKFYIE